MLQRMKTLIAKLTEADLAYYKNDAPIMIDRDYDLLYDELTQLESSTGVILAGSPTQKVSGEILEELTEVRHTRPMLSAGKVKTDEEILQFMDGRPVVMSWKLDGLTLVLRYENGTLQQAITRGRNLWRCAAKAWSAGPASTGSTKRWTNPMHIPAALRPAVFGS